MPRNESRTAGKRPMRAMTPQDKMDAIARVHAGESKAAVARDIGVPESTLRGWCKAEDKIRAQLNNVRTTGTYELTSSSDNSDNSRPGSSSRSTPTQNTMLSCTERGSEEPETGPAPKRIKLENNLVTSATATATANAAAVAAAAAAINMNSMTPRTPTMGSETSALFQPYLYNLLAGDPKTLTLLNAFMKGDILSFPTCPYTPPATNLLMDNNLHLQQSRTRNNGAMANLLSTNNMLVNGRRRYNTTGLSSTMENPTKVTAKRQNSQSPNAERPSGSISQPPTNNRTSSPLSMPSTSANNGRVVTNTSAKSSKESSNKTLHDIISQLQQQQGAVPSGRECNMGEMISTTAMNNNNNNDHHHVDNETTSSNTLPPGFSDMITYCTKLIDWLQAYGTPICTFQQVTHIKTILDSMTNWANSKEVQPKKKSNGTS